MHQSIKPVKHCPHNASVHMSDAYTTVMDPRKVIKKLMEREGFKSDRAAAIAAGISQPTLNRYMTGKSEDMEVASWRALARLFDVTVSQLLGETALDSDPQVQSVIRAMERLPAAEREALVAAANAMAASIAGRSTH